MLLRQPCISSFQNPQELCSQPTPIDPIRYNGWLQQQQQQQQQQQHQITAERV